MRNVGDNNGAGRVKQFRRDRRRELYAVGGDRTVDDPLAAGLCRWASGAVRSTCAIRRQIVGRIINYISDPLKHKEKKLAALSVKPRDGGKAAIFDLIERDGSLIWIDRRTGTGDGAQVANLAGALESAAHKWADSCELSIDVY